jgi:hypothetical protein
MPLTRENADEHTGSNEIRLVTETPELVQRFSTDTRVDLAHIALMMDSWC